MEAILKYDLNDPEDRMAHMRAVKSYDMACALFQITRNLKRKLEHRFESQPQDDRDEFDGLDEAFREIQGYMEEFNINVDELID